MIYSGKQREIDAANTLCDECEDELEGQWDSGASDTWRMARLGADRRQEVSSCQGRWRQPSDT